MRWLLGSLAAVLSLVLPSSHAMATTRHAAPRLTVLVVAGQSNAMGYQSYAVDPSTHKHVFAGTKYAAADKHVLLTWVQSDVSGGALPPVPLATPQKLSGAPSPIFGPEVGLARYLYNSGQKSLLVVKVAFRGASLSTDFAPGAPDYKALINQVRAAMVWATFNHWSPKIGGVYWMQGETDAMSAAAASGYGAHLKQFISDVRRDLAVGTTTPFVIGQIDLSDYIAFEQVNGLCATLSCSQEKLWNAEVMNAESKAASRSVFVVSTSKLPRFEHFLHLSNAGELSLGTDFGKVSRSHLT